MSDDLQPLSFASGPLVWIDCEMTGLDPRTDKILEIAVGSQPIALFVWSRYMEHV